VHVHKQAIDVAVDSLMGLDSLNIDIFIASFVEYTED